MNIINRYGSTENTTFSTTYLSNETHKRNIPIGKPIAKSTAYIVDKYGNLQPILSQTNKKGIVNAQQEAVSSAIFEVETQNLASLQ